MTRLRYIAAALGVLAFFFSLPIVEPQEISRLVCIVLMTVAAGFAAGSYMPRGFPLPRSILLVLIGLFSLNATASLLWTTSLTVSVIALGTFSLLPAGVLLGMAVADHPRALKAGAIGGGIILGALAVWAVVQYLFLPDRLVYGGVRHPFADSNAYAMVLMLGFFPALAALLGTDKKTSNFALLLCALLAVAIVLLNARGVLLFTLAAVVIFLSLTRVHWRRHVRCGGLLALLALAAFLLPTLFEDNRTEPLIRMGRLWNDSAAVADTRFLVWRAAWDLIMDNPWWGNGLGTFFLFYPAYRLPGENFSAGVMAHNDLLQFWAEIGIVAPFLFVTFCVVSIVTMIRFSRRVDPGNPERILPSALFCALGVLVAHSQISFDLFVAPILCLSGILMGVWIVRVTQARIIFRPGQALGGSVIVPVMLLVFGVQSFILSEYHVNQGRSALMKGDITRFVDHVNAADRQGMGYNARALVLAASVPLGVVESEEGKLSLQEKEKLIAQAEDLLARAWKQNARLVSIPYLQAQLAMVTGKDPGEMLYKALSINPQHLPTRLMLAETLEKKDRLDEAYSVLKDGLSWRYTLHDPRLYYDRLAIRAARREDEQVFKDVMQKNMEIDAGLKRSRAESSKGRLFTFDE